MAVCSCLQQRVCSRRQKTLEQSEHTSSNTLQNHQSLILTQTQHTHLLQHSLPHSTQTTREDPPHSHSIRLQVITHSNSHSQQRCDEDNETIALHYSLAPVSANLLTQLDPLTHFAQPTQCPRPPSRTGERQRPSPHSPTRAGLVLNRILKHHSPTPRENTHTTILCPTTAI